VETKICANEGKDGRIITLKAQSGKENEGQEICSLALKVRRRSLTTGYEADIIGVHGRDATITIVKSLKVDRDPLPAELEQLGV